MATRKARPVDDSYLRYLERKRRQEEQARDFARPAPVEPKPEPAVRESPFKPTPIALPPESPVIRESPSVRESPKPSKGAGDSRVKHDFFDNRICGLHEHAQLLYFHLNRYREGASELTVPVTWKRLTERVPVSESSLRRAFAVLNRAGLAFIHRHVYGRNSAQGIVFRVVRGESPSTHESPSTGDTHKKKEQKANQKGASPCDCFKEPPVGYYYPSGTVGVGTPKKCDHREGD